MLSSSQHFLSACLDRISGALYLGNFATSYYYPDKPDHHFIISGDTITPSEPLTQDEILRGYRYVINASKAHVEISLEPRDNTRKNRNYTLFPNGNMIETGTDDRKYAPPDNTRDMVIPVINHALKYSGLRLSRTMKRAISFKTADKRLTV